ncbi:HAD-IB family hydrolase [Streptacidiphilus pinicola]|uniref:HAD-IB family hydrolase n=1 Tax=Streptacidiphilus pinicola TaxID=2219663 RepID=A0A2X0IAT2_9ACTN|nr:HAD-IB family hydrolase [Streptacidiphilus pinicola]RAG80471.1 HAD-IB family hydrolase [Streptacidiphilus pinicola]
MSPIKAPAAELAMFDVDETLITVKSMFRFLEYDFQARGLAPRAYRQAAERLHRRSAAGVSRQQTNREYYQLFAGRPVDETLANGRAWFAEELAGGRLLHQPVLAALRRHQARGAVVVLVSGSFRPALEPLAELLEVQEVLCSEPEIVAGHYTGQLERPVIGVEKGWLASEMLLRYGVAREHAFAYADHASDLPLLHAVGHPMAVGDDTVLAEHVARTGGGSLPGVRRPA